MNIPEWVWFLIIGAAAGWLAGTIMRGGGFGLIGNIIVGIVGAVVGGWLFSIMGIAAGASLIGSLVTSVIGAVVLLYVVSLLKKA
jgi:uncharacterized membrane protein YeaQ/YmgE (transglycosylase-associated protein family)